MSDYLIYQVSAHQTKHLGSSQKSHLSLPGLHLSPSHIIPLIWLTIRVGLWDMSRRLTGLELGHSPLNQTLLTSLPYQGSFPQRGDVTGQGFPEKAGVLMLLLCLLSPGAISSPQMAFFSPGQEFFKPRPPVACTQGFCLLSKITPWVTCAWRIHISTCCLCCAVPSI